MRERLGKRELERKRIEDAGRLALEDPNHRWVGRRGRERACEFCESTRPCLVLPRTPCLLTLHPPSLLPQLRCGAEGYSGLPGGCRGRGAAARRASAVQPAAGQVLDVGADGRHRLPCLPRAHGCAAGGWPGDGGPAGMVLAAHLAAHHAQDCCMHGPATAQRHACHALTRAADAPLLAQSTRTVSSWLSAASGGCWCRARTRRPSSTACLSTAWTARAPWRRSGMWQAGRALQGCAARMPAPAPPLRAALPVRRPALPPARIRQRLRSLPACVPRPPWPTCWQDQGQSGAGSGHPQG